MQVLAPAPVARYAFLRRYGHRARPRQLDEQRKLFQTYTFSFQDRAVSGELCSLAYVNAVLNIPHLNQKRNYTIVREPGYRLECASATPLLSRNGVYKRIPRNLHRYAF